jgi:uncharacterized membrane protein YfcA
MLGASLLAGLLRGFSGFALSAAVMASLSSVISPIELLPICFWLEVVASLFMLRGGMKEADMSIVWGLVIGTLIGMPIGLLILTQIDVQLSKIVALVLILSLASLIFIKVKAHFLATKSGLYISGIAAGLASGIAAVGGMVVALYVLAREKPAAQMRASLVMFLLISEVGTGIYFYIYDIFTLDSIKRVLVMTPLLSAGILIGSLFFNPSLAKYYKPICLMILMGICALNLAKQVF